MTKEQLYYIDIIGEPIIAKDNESAVIAFAKYMQKHPDMFTDCCTEYEDDYEIVEE